LVLIATKSLEIVSHLFDAEFEEDFTAENNTIQIAAFSDHGKDLRLLEWKRPPRHPQAAL
jgi:hypothetical protein